MGTWRNGAGAWRVVGLAVVLAGAGAASPLVQSEGSRRVATAARTPHPPVIDGVLDEAEWELATPIGELHMVEPVQNGDPSQSSDIRILYDTDYIYLGMRFYDDDPSAIVSPTAERDAFLNESDYSEIVFDTFLDRRNAFFFQINPTGSMGDALITNNGADFNKPWDGIWNARTRIDAEGWVAELALPFKTLNFDPEVDHWGFNVTRKIGRTREQLRWSDPNRDYRFFQILHAGDLVGLDGIEQGAGVDLRPFFVGDWRNERELDDTDVLGDIGMDALVRLSPSLNLSLTYNTDFAETEVDARRINLTRFPLFFPEQRDFFLQDAGVFDFDGPGNDVIPFFSRRIGLSGDGEPVPLLGGAKLTGRVGDTNLGVLGAATDSVTNEDGETISEQGLFAARVQQNIGQASTMGGVVTSGNPSGESDETLYGMDFNFRTSGFRGDKNLNAGAWFLRSDSSDPESNEDLAFGAQINSPNNITNWYFSALEIQDEFDPALGFVPRRGIRKYGAGGAYEPRINENIRSLEFSVDASLVTNTQNEFATFFSEVQPLGVFWESGESLRVEVEFTQEDIVEEFTINNVDIPVDEYDFVRYRLEFDTADQRDFSAGAAFTTGDFFGGTRDDIRASVNWRPGSTSVFAGSLEAEQNDVDLPGGSFQTQLARARLNFSFNPDVSWNSFIQWDSVSKAVGINSRLRYIPRPGHDVFVVFNETLQHEDDSLYPTFQGVTFKVAYTLRF